MEKAWIDYKTDEETFKTIVNYEEDFVYDMMRKKYGKDFDGINVKSSIKRSEIYKYNLADDLIKLDVLCAEKLKARGKNIAGFFSNSTDLMSRKLCTAYDLNSIELGAVITCISSEYRDVFVYASGINRKKVKMPVIVSMFNTTTDDAYMKIAFALREIEKIVKDRKNRLTESSQKKTTIPNLSQKHYGQNFDKIKSPISPAPKGDEKTILNVQRGSNNGIEKIKQTETSEIQEKQENPQIEVSKTNPKENPSSNGDGKMRKRKNVPIDKHQTLNEYYQARGFSKEALENLYSKLTARGKAYFDKYIEVIENDDNTHTFKIKKAIPKYDKDSRDYFTKSACAVLSKFANTEAVSAEIEAIKPTKENDNKPSIDLKNNVTAYLSALKLSKIITKDLIINLQLPKKYEYFLLTEFDTNGNNEFSLEEEAEFLNMSVEELCKHLIESIEYLKTQLNDKLSMDKSRVEKLLNNNTQPDDGEVDMKKTLN